MNREIQFILYNTPQENVTIEAVVKDDTLWLTQKAMSQLFGVDRSVITKHLSNIFSENELSKEATCANFAQIQIEGLRTVSRDIEFYNLDAIISVGVSCFPQIPNIN